MKHGLHLCPAIRLYQCSDVGCYGAKSLASAFRALVETCYRTPSKSDNFMCFSCHFENWISQVPSRVFLFHVLINLRPHSELRWKPVVGRRASQGWVLAGHATSTPACHRGARMQPIHFIQTNTQIYKILKLHCRLLSFSGCLCCLQKN